MMGDAEEQFLKYVSKFRMWRLTVLIWKYEASRSRPIPNTLMLASGMCSSDVGLALIYGNCCLPAKHLWVRWASMKVVLWHKRRHRVVKGVVSYSCAVRLMLSWKETSRQFNAHHECGFCHPMANVHLPLGICAILKRCPRSYATYNTLKYHTFLSPVHGNMAECPCQLYNILMSTIRKSFATRCLTTGFCCSFSQFICVPSVLYPGAC